MKLCDKCKKEINDNYIIVKHQDSQDTYPVSTLEFCNECWVSIRRPILRLSGKQQQIFNFIKDYINKHGFSPTFKEMSKEFNKAPSVIYAHVKNLEKKGYLLRMANEARSLHLS